MPPLQPFNFDFDAEHGQELIKIVQSYVGCFFCNKPDPGKTCARCLVSMYCNQDCQKKDWKTSGENAGHHKHLCKTYNENHAKREGAMGPIPISLFYVDWIDEGTFESSMQERGELFLQELHRYQQERGEIIRLFAQLSVIRMIDGKISLTAAVSFLVNGERGSTAAFVMLETVDEGEVAENRLNPRGRGPGDISTAAAAKVLECWCAYIRRLRNECSANIYSVTYGRGLMHVADKSSFREIVEAANGDTVVWVPNTEHSMFLMMNEMRDHLRR
jgi:hypothetical protein